MAYRKTEKVLAQLEAKRSGLIAAAIDVIEKVGLDGLTTDLVAERAGVASGLLYRYFPDKTELLAAAVAQCLERDLTAMKAASNTFSPADALSNSISTLASRWVLNYRTISQIGRFPAYREGVRRELARLIRASDAVESPAILASVVYGALFEAAGHIRPRDEPALCAAVLRACGVKVPARAGAVA
jgi:AcrR family transcriptional regulator